MPLHVAPRTDRDLRNLANTVKIVDNGIQIIRMCVGKPGQLRYLTQREGIRM